MSEQHVTKCVDVNVYRNGIAYRGTSWSCECGAKGDCSVRDGSAEADAHHHRLANVPGLREEVERNRAIYRAEMEAQLEANRKATEARRRDSEEARAEQLKHREITRAMELTKDYVHLREDHAQCRFEEPDHPCSCFRAPPCSNCENCPAYNEEAWALPV